VNTPSTVRRPAIDLTQRFGVATFTRPDGVQHVTNHNICDVEPANTEPGDAFRHSKQNENFKLNFDDIFTTDSDAKNALAMMSFHINPLGTDILKYEPVHDLHLTKRLSETPNLFCKLKYKLVAPSQVMDASEYRYYLALNPPDYALVSKPTEEILTSITINRADNKISMATRELPVKLFYVYINLCPGLRVPNHPISTSWLDCAGKC
jgi:hypothetical protein